MKTKSIINHLKDCDTLLRVLFGFYWHRRHTGLGQSRLDGLAKTIRHGVTLIAELEHPEWRKKSEKKLKKGVDRKVKI